MVNFLKIVLALVCMVFLLALGVLGGCLASASMNANGNLVGICMIGGGIAGLLGGIFLAMKIFGR